MLQYWSHLRYTLIHKFWVMKYCFEEGLYLQGLIHDISKFSPSEFTGYANFFFDKQGNNIPYSDNINETYSTAFTYAWNHHQKYNKHHWQYWCQIKHDGTVKCLDIPLRYLQEMICDWRGAGKAQGDNPTGSYECMFAYFNEHKNTILLSSNSEKLLISLIMAGIRKEKNYDLYR